MYDSAVFASYRRSTVYTNDRIECQRLSIELTERTSTFKREKSVQGELHQEALEVGAH